MRTYEGEHLSKIITWLTDFCHATVPPDTATIIECRYDEPPPVGAILVASGSSLVWYAMPARPN